MKKRRPGHWARGAVWPGCFRGTAARLPNVKLLARLRRRGYLYSIMLAYLFYLLLGYLAFRFIVGFVIPIVRTTRQVRRSFRQMQEQMGGHGGAPGSGSAGSASGPRVVPKGSAKEDYIDFEEIKD